MLSSIFGSRPAQANSAADGNTAFAFDLYAQLKSRDGNLFFSPYSISTALAMTYGGARGDTAKQMAAVLHFSGDPKQVHSAFGELQRKLADAGKGKGIELNVANALWAQRGHAFLAEYLKIAKDDFQANINQADFKTDAETVRSEINGWVAKQTRDKIENILSQGSLNPMSRLVLVNAIYFKGLWANPFEKSDTTTKPFHVSTSKDVDIQMMHHFDQMRYLENADFQAVELPYQGDQLSMVVLLPRQIDGCGALENKLDAALLSRSFDQMKKRKVEIFLPRFKLESSLDLNGPLTKLGMADAFGAKADFSGMDGTKNLFITGVFHKAWGEVNEEGTEAAAATAVAVGALSMQKPPPPPPIFRADHPFIFLIRDTQTGSVLFLGRFSKPQS